MVAALLAGCGDQQAGESGDPDPASATPTKAASATPTETAPATPTETAGTPSMVLGGEQPWLTSDGDTLVSCSGDPFFPASLVDSGGLELSPEESEEIVAALAQMREDFGIDAPAPLQEAEAEDVPWLVLWQEDRGGDDYLGLLIAPAGSTEFSLATDDYATLHRQGDRWAANSWSGTCGARPAVPPEVSWVQLALPDDDDAPADGTDQTAATVSPGAVELLVSEVECTSARDPEPFLAEPVVVESAESVTVFWTTEAVVGGADCPGNPWVARTINLEEPLGDRELLDGSTWPPTRVTTVEDYG